MNKMILALAGVAGVVCAVSAKTVALWTLMDAESRVNVQCPTVNGRDAFGRYDFTVPSEGVVATARCGDWELPPNPDAEPGRLLLGSNTGAYKLQDAARYFRNDPVALDHLSLDRDFTLEGWINLPQLPAANNWLYVAGPRRRRGRCRGRRAGWARTRSVRGSRRQSRGRCRRGGR